MGNLRLQNELPRCPDLDVDVDGEHSRYDNTGEESYEEDYIRTESYFSSASQHLHPETCAQPLVSDR